MSKNVLIGTFLSVLLVYYCNAMEISNESGDGVNRDLEFAEKALRSATFTMPDEESLEDLFTTFKLDHFAEKTCAARRLACKTLTAEEIENVKRTLLKDYSMVLNFVSAYSVDSTFLQLPEEWKSLELECFSAGSFLQNIERKSKRLLIFTERAFDDMIDLLLQLNLNIKAQLLWIRKSQ